MIEWLEEYFFQRRLAKKVYSHSFCFRDGDKIHSNTITFDEGIAFSEMLTVAIDFATLTKCVPETQILIDETVLDEPNVPGMLEVLVAAGIAEDTGKFVEMGFNSYPIIKVKNGGNVCG